MAGQRQHDYHILPPSIWPFIGAAGGFTLLFGLVLLFHGNGPWVAMIGLVTVLYTMFCWWSDVIAEARIGDHTPVVQIGLRYGMIMFIVSEIMFFSAWFWSFFKNALYPMAAIDHTWPPPGIETSISAMSGACSPTWMRPDWPRIPSSFTRRTKVSTSAITAGTTSAGCTRSRCACRCSCAGRA